MRSTSTSLREETASRVDLDLLERMFRVESGRKGLLVSIVGFDGSGKTTQVTELGERFRRLGREVVETRQPSDWYRNEPIVQLFHDQGGSVEKARILSLFAAADRHRHVLEVIDPALARGAVVICDRYVYATFGVFIHRGIDFTFLATINAGVPRPDFALYLEVPDEILMERLRARDGDDLKYEEREMDRVQSITRTYRELIPHLIPIDGSRGKAEVSAEIWSHMVKSN